MNKEFIENLTAFLDSECDDYDLSFEIKFDTYDEYSESINVYILMDGEFKTSETFVWMKYKTCKYGGSKSGIVWVEEYGLHIEMGEDCFEHIAIHESSVKYFWMKVAPELWGGQ